MKSMWVVPFKGTAIVDECLTSIHAHHINPDVVTVSAEWNKHYGPGAFKHVFEANLDVDFFYFIFDSLIINDNLDDLMESELTTIRHFDYPENGWGWDEDGTPLDQWARDRGVVTPDAFSGVMGPMICAHRSVIEAADLFRILPTSAYEQCALERCWGIWLTEAGYDVTNSLQGPMHGFWDDYDESRVKKIAMARP